MKSVEERYNAWIDGTLPEAEVARLEGELRSDAATLQREREGARRLGGLLREHLAAPPLANAGFFNHQLMQRIAAEAPVAPPARSFWQRYGWRFLGSVAMGGAVAALALTALTREALPPEATHYHAHLMETEAGEPGISAVALQVGEEEMAVVWLDGLDYLPGETAAVIKNRKP